MDQIRLTGLILIISLFRRIQFLVEEQMISFMVDQILSTNKKSSIAAALYELF